MKTPRLNTKTIFAFLTLTFSFSTFAASQWYLPASLYAVRIQNPTASMVRMYLSGPAGSNEEMLEVAAQSMITYDLTTSPVLGFHILRTDDGAPVSVSISHNGRNYARTLKGRTTDLELYGSSSDQKADVYLTNLSPLAQKASVNGAPFTLKKFEQKKVLVNWIKGSSILIQADYPVSAYAVVNNQTFTFVGRAKATAQVAKNSGYFLVAAGGSSDSFVVKLDDPALIQSARDQIKNPKQARTLIANIQFGSSGFNQDLVSSYKSAWSWSVSKVISFGDSDRSCDGTPTFVENYLESWIAAKKPICFSNYKIMKEL
jgi:hypothetical protein